jgi:hypothetical protein
MVRVQRKAAIASIPTLPNSHIDSPFKRFVKKR